MTRQNPGIRRLLHIVKLFPHGFCTAVEVKGKQMVPFQSAAIPLKHTKHTKKYVEEKSPQPLDGAARIDALILFVVSKATVTLCPSE